MGLAASAGSVIAMAGDEILIPDAGLMMIHNARAMVSGDRREMAYANTMLATFDDAMASVYAARSGLEKDAVAEMMNRDTWFNGAEALAAGLADGILAPEKVTQTDEPGAKATAAIRKVDAALARQGLSRQERRSLLGELKGGKPGAAATATHDAGALTADLRRLIETLQ